MITVNIRKQGGAAVITIPSDVLRLLNLEIGSTLELDLTHDGFIAHTIRQKTRKRYTINELLQGISEADANILRKATKSLREGKAVGREVE